LNTSLKFAYKKTQNYNDVFNFTSYYRNAILSKSNLYSEYVHNKHYALSNIAY